jgi:hypothetical protein
MALYKDRATKRPAKEQYWNEVLTPQVRSDFLDEAQDKFMSEK